MIYSTQSVFPLPAWDKGHTVLTEDMRLRLAKRARMHGHVLDESDIIEFVHIKQDLHGTWRSVSPENATHIRVTLEVMVT